MGVPASTKRKQRRLSLQAPHRPRRRSIHPPGRLRSLHPLGIFHPSESNGLILGIATTHFSGPELAQAFTTVTGHQAEYIDLPAEEFVQTRFGDLPNGVNTKVGIASVKDTNALLMTFGENFTNWWNLYKASADNNGLIQRDCALLDRILPDRVKSAEEWMRKVNYDANKRLVIKTGERMAMVKG